MSDLRPILFTAFEPSGDALAAPVIAHIKAIQPDRPIVAMGGPKMAQAGAQLIETTTGHAVMLADALAHVQEHRRRIGVLRQWMQTHHPAAVVPTDSPAANWATCKLARKLHPQARIIHLAAPQLWAWAPWRIHKLRRLTDRVMCLLPFEPAWFSQRGVRATFVSHPIFESPASLTETSFAQGHPRLALLPGSRASEIKRNWPTMEQAYRVLQQRHPKLVGIIAAADDARRDQLLHLMPSGLPDALEIVTGQTGQVLTWADVSLTVSGTATLQTAAHNTPMVVLYNVNRLSWELVGRWLIRHRPLSLPNLISQSVGLGSVVPELMPHFGQAQPVVQALEPLLSTPQARDRQREAFATIRQHFHNVPFAQTAGATLLGELEGANKKTTR